jgi:hypothetical protein
MRVRKICTNCGKLKLMCDFSKNEESLDRKTEQCNDCINDTLFGEFNSKINNNQIVKKMATLKENRAAEAAAKAEAGEVTTPKAETKEVKAPKVGDTTEDGLKVVGEKKEPGKRGRKAAPEKPIEQLDLETGTIVIATYQTLQEAAEAVGAKPASLLDGLRGWTKSVAKHKWRYQGEEIFVRTPKTPVAKEFLDKGAVKETKTVDVPVPGDLDYDEELHGQKPVVEEEVLDSQVEDDSVLEEQE